MFKDKDRIIEVEGNWIRFWIYDYGAFLRLDIENNPIHDTETANLAEHEAWEKTFEKWSMIRTGVTLLKMLEPNVVVMELGGMQTCGLCNMHYRNICAGCPIMSFTKEGMCTNTPNAYIEAWTNPYSNYEITPERLDKIGLWIDQEIALLKTIYQFENE